MDYSKFRNEELIQMLANAQKTLGECLGHSKAERNEMAVEKMTVELAKRGVEIPKDNQENGEFNGEGAL